MSDSCLFCDIVNKKIPTSLIFENDQVAAFNDINPQAPVHLLIIPKKHITNMESISDADSSLLDEIFKTARHLAKEKKIASSGYRLIANCNAEGGQTVNHLHFHLMGGRQMNWPPG